MNLVEDNSPIRTADFHTKIKLFCEYDLSLLFAIKEVSYGAFVFYSGVDVLWVFRINRCAID